MLYALGILLALVGIGLLAHIESGLRNYRSAILRHGGEIQNLDAASASTRHSEGQMLRVYGALEVPVPPRDPEFGQSAAGVLLIRHVSMFQWRQIDIAGRVHYELDWVDHPVDARSFAIPRGHANPANFPIQGRQFDASRVQLKGLELSPALVHAIPGSMLITPDPSRLPVNLQASFSLSGHYLLTSASPSSPTLGDLRLSWETVPLQSVTVVARVRSGQLQPALDPEDGKGFQLQLGNRSLVDLFPDLQLPPDAANARRWLAMVLLLAGALLLFVGRPRDPIEFLLPAGAALLLAGTVAGVIWLGASNDMSLRWAGCALLGCALIGVLAWQRHRAGQMPTG